MVIFTSILCKPWLIVKIFLVWNWLWYMLTLCVWIGRLTIHIRIFRCFWPIYIVIIMLCKIIFMWCSLFIWWLCCWSKCLIIRFWVFWATEGFTVECMVVCFNVRIFFWTCKGRMNKWIALVCCCRYCFNYFFTYKMWWSLDILLCKISCSVQVVLLYKSGV